MKSEFVFGKGTHEARRAELRGQKRVLWPQMSLSCPVNLGCLGVLATPEWSG